MKNLFGTEKMLALSWKEPFAGLMLPPFNKIETRIWRTNYRGLVLICASQKGYNLPQLQIISAQEQIEKINGIYLNEKVFNGMPDYFGHAIAVGRLSECRPMQKSDEEKCFVRYHSDLFCHIYSDVRPIKPMPWKGSQGWKEVPQDFINQIQYL